MHPNELRRLLKRCLSIDKNGDIYGYSALIPHKRLKEYERNSDGEVTDKRLTGAFNNLLERYPRVKENIISTFFEKDKGAIVDPNIKVNRLHKMFIKWCANEGIKEHEYPFISNNLALRSLYRYTQKLENEYLGEASKRRGHDAQKLIKTTGVGTINSNNLVNRPFQQVQFDGHKIDAIFSITFKTPDGDEITKDVDRIWILAIIDVATRTILGYHLCISKEYSSVDVLACIKNAIVPKEQIPLTIPNLQYPENHGFASIEISESRWALWDEILYDNAKANLASIVTTKLTEVVGCSINAGPVSTPVRRNLVERFFKTLEENGYHRLPNTTGSDSKDTRRRDPDKKAIKYKISIDHLEELTEILIANYNVTPHEGIYGFSPLELMEQRIERGMYPRIMAEEKQNDVMFLSITTQRTIRGSLKTGRRPHIHYEGVEYRNEVLSRSPDLVGMKLDILVDVDDLRNIRAFLPDGSEFGVLTAIGKWGISPHDLKTRKAINSLIDKKQMFINSRQDPIELYHNYLTQSAISKKSDRTKLAKQQKYKGRKEKINKSDDVLGQPLEDNCKSPILNFESTKLAYKHPQDEKKGKLEDLRKLKSFRTINI